MPHDRIVMRLGRAWVQAVPASEVAGTRYGADQMKALDSER